MKTRHAFLTGLILLFPAFVSGQVPTGPEMQKILSLLRTGDPNNADAAIKACNPKVFGYRTCVAVRGIAYGIKKDVGKAILELQLTDLDKRQNKNDALEDPTNAVFYTLIEQHVKPYYDHVEGNWLWNDPKSAVQKFTAAVTAFPQFYKAWGELSEKQLEAGNYAAALDSINKAIISVPDLREHTYGRHDIGYFFDRADIYLAMGDAGSKAKALIDVKKAMTMGSVYETQGKLYLVELDAPQGIPDKQRLRDHCWRWKIPTAAIACFDSAIKHVPDDQKDDLRTMPAWLVELERMEFKKRYLYLARAEILQKQKQWNEAAADFEMYVKLTDQLDPSGEGVDPRTLRNAGISYHAAKKYDAAIKTMSRSLNEDPEDAFAFYLRGKSYWALKRLDAALADYNAAIKIRPVQEFWNDRAHILMEKGSKTAAISDLKEVLKLDPNNQDAKKHLEEMGVKL